MWTLWAVLGCGQPSGSEPDDHRLEVWDLEVAPDGLDFGFVQLGQSASTVAHDPQQRDERRAHRAVRLLGPRHPRGDRVRYSEDPAGEDAPAHRRVDPVRNGATRRRLARSAGGERR
jgi:hypothetical protein